MENGERKCEERNSRDPPDAGRQPVETVDKVNRVDQGDGEDDSQDCGLDLIQNDRGAPMPGNVEEVPTQPQQTHDRRASDLPNQFHQSRNVIQVVDNADNNDDEGSP